MPETSPQPDKPPQPTRRWKRTAAAALLLLVGGAIVNVAVAWGCVIWSTVSENPTDLRWRAELTDGMVGVPSVAWVDAGVGYRETFVRGELTPPIVPRDDDPWFRFEEVTQLELRAGLPLTSLRSLRQCLVWPSNWNTEPCMFENPIRFRDGLPLPERITPFEHGRRCLPTMPIIPGIIINTLFYAVILWLLFITPFVVRRMLRRRRGLCEQCAYPIGVSPVCTECGAAVRPLVARSS